MSDWDTSELTDLAVEWQGTATQLARKLRPVVSKGALNIKNTMRADVAKSKYFPFAHTISYDLTTSANGVEAEIGPEAGGLAAFAGIAYFGGVNGGGATVRDPGEPLAEEEPRFIRALEDIVAEVMGK